MYIILCVERKIKQVGPSQPGPLHVAMSAVFSTWSSWRVSWQTEESRLCWPSAALTELPAVNYTAWPHGSMYSRGSTQSQQLSALKNNHLASHQLT